ncbi:unnamed protein product [Clavelina lepadiformis]|uniref:Solute carrier organic anion transporter family member n=1 Tax=Clavelina lepadiformis TaxID=159417 RepID=A0ABP0FM54_CLALP
MSLTKKFRLSVDSSESQIDVDLPKEETCGCEVGCAGCWESERFPAKNCQTFATTKWALFFFSLGGVVQGFLVNGHTPVIISTIEKRFELTSTESGLIASMYDIGGSLTILFVTYVGGRRHKPQWVGWGLFMVGLSGIIFSIPHFVAPTYSFQEMTNVCGNSATENCVISTLKNFRFVFYFAMLITGVGSSPLYSLAITFLDENVKQRYSALYNGILITMSIVGPGIGFLAGAALLDIYTYPSETVTINQSSENWVGAWWMGSFIIGFVGIFVSIPVLMLPRVIPGTEKHRMEREKEIHHSAQDTAQKEVFGKSFRDFPQCTLTLLRNPTFLFLSLGTALDSVLIGGFAVFGAKYLETQFALGVSQAGTYFGLMAILGGAGGQLAGGGSIAKFNLKVPTMLQINYVAPVFAVACGGVYFITCSNLAFAGVNSAYSGSSAINGISDSCNADCGCEEGVYHPVCGSDGVTYFSPCFAGCESQNGDTYNNCTCIVSTAANSSATTGFCTDESCSKSWQLIVFCFFNFLLMFLTFVNEASVLQASLRCVAFNQRSFAIGLQVLFSRILGTVPGPLIVGALFDRACSKWTQECGTRGSCLIYDNKNLSLYLAVFIIVIKLLDALIFWIAHLRYKPIPAEFTDDDACVEEDKHSISDDKTEEPNKDVKLVTKSNGSAHAPVIEQPISRDKVSSALPGETLSSNTFDNRSFVADDAFKPR